MQRHPHIRAVRPSTAARAVTLGSCRRGALIAAVYALAGLALIVPWMLHRRTARTALRLAPPSLPRTCEPKPPWLDGALAFIHTSQHPPQRVCATLSGFLWQGEPFYINDPASRRETNPDEGYGSTMSAIASGLLLAFGVGRVLVFTDDGWSYGGSPECEANHARGSGKWNCLFEPLSSCTFGDLERARQQDAATFPQQSDHDLPAWYHNEARYVHKDTLRMLPDGVMANRFTLHIPEGMRSLGIGRQEWTAASFAYLHALILPDVERIITGTYVAPVRDSLFERSEHLYDAIGVHLRLRDKGGGTNEAELSGSWLRTASYIRSIYSAFSARMPIVVASDVPASVLSRLASTLSPDLPPPVWVPVLVPNPETFASTSVLSGAMANHLSLHPEMRENATIDAMAVVEVLSQCRVLLGRPDSLLFRFTAALHLARGCGRRADSESALRVWSLRDGTPVDLDLASLFEPE